MRFPWSRNQTDGDTEDEESEPHRDIEPVISCEFQDGTLFVFEDQLFIERTSKSTFSDRWIALDAVRGVRYSKRFVISYIQITQDDVDNDDGGLLSTPVDENTLHFGWGKRECAKRARDEILERTEPGTDLG